MVPWKYHYMAWYAARCLARDFRFLAGDADGELDESGQVYQTLRPKKEHFTLSCGNWDVRGRIKGVFGGISMELTPDIPTGSRTAPH